MLKLLPHWAKALMPRMPASLGRRIMGAESSPKPYAPALLGASTFFLPCAFTATMQIYALGVGSFAGGAAVLGGFALGTVPGLLALGWASAAGRGGFGRFFFRFAGTAIVVLGFVGIGNGLAVMGVTYTPPGGDRLTAAAVAMDDGQAQTVSMKVNPDSYEPSNLTIKAGLKTIWKIDATEAAGCIRSLVSRQLGIKKLLDQGENTVEFTAPSVPGTYGFSCSMGMYRGTFTVVN
jgi:plastocyanin